MNKLPKPHIIRFQSEGEPAEGFLSIAEYGTQVPFEIKRVFWTYQTPEHIVRGRHAHRETEQVLIAITGRITVTTESRSREFQTFVLDGPDMGVYLPPHLYRTMVYGEGAVQLVLASTLYQPDDYVHYDEFFKADEK